MKNTIRYGSSVIFVFLAFGCFPEKENQKSSLPDCRLSGTTATEDELTACENRCGEGDASSCLKLAHYWTGDHPMRCKPLKKDYTLARKYYSLTAKHDVSRRGKAANFWLGELYRDGKGGDIDMSTARRFFRKGCNLGHGASCRELGIIAYKVNGRLPEGRALFEKACKLKDLFSCPQNNLNNKIDEPELLEVIEILQGQREPNQDGTLQHQKSDK